MIDNDMIAWALNNTVGCNAGSDTIYVASKSKLFPGERQRLISHVSKDQQLAALHAVLVVTDGSAFKKKDIRANIMALWAS